MKKLVALTGFKAVGKSTLARELEMSLGYRRVSFAQPIREMLEVLGVNAADMSPENKEKPLPWLGASPRKLMQTLGTEWGRDLISPDIWVRVAQKKIVEQIEGGSPVVVDDLRFENEAIMVRSLGGSVVRIEHPAVASGDGHRSERPLPDDYVDAVLCNDGTERELFEKLETLRRD